jgi:hypothetical protein
MNKWLLLFLVFLAACSNKKKDEEEADNSKFLPVPAILKAQIRDVDTSLYSIIRIHTVDNNPAETSYIKREEFKTYAKDFLDLPDLTQKKWKGDYTETNFYDEALQSGILTYTAKEEDLETRKQELLTEPTPNGDLKVRTIIAETLKEKNGAVIRKNMIWHLDKRFQVITTTEKNNEPEKVEKLQVVWNYN